ncbi:MAG: selenocysteine-specific translation elongation factor [Pyrinomonadaceae bacterium]
MNIIVGTAGHIDHGKTALVKALTGVDADRLPEEKRRGITVDLGFAEMSIGDLHFGFVDVPGHERFVKNMLAGASGIDIVILIIAATEGVMPQTHEHFDICRLLGINAGIIALTKSDLADAETLELAKLEAAELVADSFLEDAPVVPVSSHTGDGVDEIRQALQIVAETLTARREGLIARLPVDRSFSMKGFGAVVTGTLISGEIAVGNEMELLPDGRKVRVRGLQTHGKAVETAHVGQRVAVNLAGVDHSEIERGIVLAERDVLRPTQIIDVEMEVLPTAARSLRSRQRVRLHIGTAEVLARATVLNDKDEIEPGGRDLVQLTTEKRVTAVPGDRFIIRSYSPQITIAGGVIIDNAATKHRRKDRPMVVEHLGKLLESSDNMDVMVSTLIESCSSMGTTIADLQARTGLTKSIIRDALDNVVNSGNAVSAGEHFVGTTHLDKLGAAAVAAVESFHKRQPLAKGMPRETLRESVFANIPDAIFQKALGIVASSGKLTLDSDTIRLGGHTSVLSPAETAVSEKLLAVYISAGLAVPKLDETLAAATAGTAITEKKARDLLHLLISGHKIVKVTDEFYFASETIENLRDRLRTFADASAGRLIDVAKFKDLAGISRKYAIPLLEYFDREKVTVRAGDKRLILK